MPRVPELHRTIRPFCYFISCILYPNFIDTVDILLSCPWRKNGRVPPINDHLSYEKSCDEQFAVHLTYSLHPLSPRQRHNGNPPLAKRKQP